eukprot:2607356-Prymnesium_polylepis.3
MQLAQWLSFISNEQLSSSQDEERGSRLSAANDQADEKVDEEAELTRARQCFEQVAGGVEIQVEKALSPVEFALQLLAPSNDAVAPVQQLAHGQSTDPRERFEDPSTNEDLHGPLSHMYMAASHNSYLIGDQLTGISTADACISAGTQTAVFCTCSKLTGVWIPLWADRRQLVQGCRHVEVELALAPRPTHSQLRSMQHQYQMCYACATDRLLGRSPPRPDRHAVSPLGSNLGQLLHLQPIDRCSDPHFASKWPHVLHQRAVHRGRQGRC